VKATQSFDIKRAGLSSGTTRKASLLLIIALVVRFAGLSAGAPILNRYSLDVRLDPALHRISATARIGIAGDPTSRTLTFLLNHQLTVTSVREGGKPVSMALEVEQHRTRLADRQPLDARTKLRLEECEQLKLAIESFFGEAGKTADLRGLTRDIAESADEIHDGVRDKKPDTIAPHLTKLTQAWEQFSHHVRTCSQIGY